MLLTSTGGDAAGEIDIGHQVPFLVDDLDVDPGPARDADKPVGEVFLREQPHKSIGVVGAEQPGYGNGAA